LAQGGIYASAEDMLLYLNDLLKQESQLISESGKREILNLQDNGAKFGYGLGWFISKNENHQLIFHFGESYGYQAVAMFSPELDIAFVVLINASSGFAHHNVSSLLRGVGDIILGYQPVGFNPPIIETVLYYLIFVIPLLILIFSFTFVKSYLSGKKVPLKRPFIISEITKRLVIPSIALLSVAYIFLYALPGP